MREVSVRILHFLHEIARAAEVDEASLYEGFPALAPRGAGKRPTPPSWMDWDDFAVLWERLEEATGGPEGFARAAHLAVSVAYPEFRALAGVFMSPVAVFRFFMFRHMRTSFRNVDVEELDFSADDVLRWRETIQPQYRPCPAYHRASRTFSTMMPLPLGLPAATSAMTILTERSAEFVVRLPAHPPLAKRGVHAASSVLTLVAAQIDEAYALIGDRLRAKPATGGDGVLAAGWPERLELSNRQRDVLALVVKGRANTEIATLLGCSERNVEFHVGRILRAARVASRSELLVKVLRSG